MIIEFAKLRRTKVVLLGFLLCAGIVLFAGMNLFVEGRLDDFRADPESSWAAHLVGYCMALAFLSPVQLAVVASRVADAENVNGGWRLNAFAGVPPGTLIVRKFAVAAVLVAVLKLVEFAGVFVMPLLMGAPAPGSDMLEAWLLFGLGAIGTSLALLGVMLWLAAVTDSQIVVLAIGVVGGFLGVAALLSPTWLATINPFGYFAMLTPFTFGETSITPTSPHWFAWGTYIITAAAVVTVATRILDRKEL